MEQLLFPCPALPGCVVGVIVHQGKLKHNGRRRRRLPGEIEQNRVRKALKELLDWEKGRDQELEEARARRRSSAWRRPGRLCPAWLLTLFASLNL